MKKIYYPFMFLFLFLLLFLFPDGWRTAHAMDLELSLAFSYNRSNYGDNGYNWSRKWSVSVGYSFTSFSEIELAFQDSIQRNYLRDYENTTFHDRVYSANWVQYFLSRTSFFQPYAKAGVGQLNRDASGTYGGGYSPPSKVDSLTGILGAGIKVYPSQRFGLKAEYVTYLTGARIKTWKDNVAAMAGVSVAF